MGYDRSETMEPAKANRELAEKYYLEYLKRDLPSFQQARVYQRLGGMFTVESDPKRGILPDYEKGTRYLQKVLELEPNRVDMTTIRARTLLASSGELSTQEYVRRGLDLYEWLLSLNDEKLQTQWLPLDPNQTAIPPMELESLRKGIPSIRHVAAINTTGTAAHMPDREAQFAAMIRRFPGTEMADMAQEHLKKLLGQAADAVMKDLESSTSKTTDAISEKGSAPSSNADAQSGAMKENAPAPQEGSSAKQSNQTPALTATSQVGAGTHVSPFVYVLGVCVALGGGVLLYIARRKRTS